MQCYIVKAQILKEVGWETTYRKDHVEDSNVEILQ